MYTWSWVVQRFETELLIIQCSDPSKWLAQYPSRWGWQGGLYIIFVSLANFSSFLSTDYIIWILVHGTPSASILQQPLELQIQVNWGALWISANMEMTFISLILVASTPLHGLLFMMTTWGRIEVAQPQLGMGSPQSHHHNMTSNFLCDMKSNVLAAENYHRAIYCAVSFSTRVFLLSHGHTGIMHVMVNGDTHYQ